MNITNKIKICIFFSICIICVFLTIFLGKKIWTWHKDNNYNEKLMNKINQIETMKTDDNPINIEGLTDINTDAVGWIKVENTNIDYPLVQTSNNDFYLKHSFDKSENGAGWIFVDYRNKLNHNDKNIVIYGHNRRDGSMFGTLKEALSKETKIELVLGKEIQKYEVFSVYTIEKEDYYLSTRFDDNEEFEHYLNTIKGRSIKPLNVDVTAEDTILTLSTCANNNDYRVVVHAKKINV